MARLLAVVLLAWTTADLCGHGVCAHDREPVVPWSSGAPGTPVSVGGAGRVADTATTADGPDDCFCCCRCIDVRVPFALPVACSFVSMVFIGHVSVPASISAPLDHPPAA